MSEFPSNKFQRGKILAQTGLKVGKNYALYYAKRSLSSDRETARNRLNQQNAAAVFEDFTQLRGTALKLAQSLSMDTGVLPEEFVEVMAQAQYRVPPMNRAIVRAIVQRELRRPAQEIFRHFDDTAIAAASIGQVHRAVDHDGKQLAIKLQYPHVRETIRSDLAMARVLFRPLFKGDNIDIYFNEIRDKLLEETDYLQEGRYLDIFSGIYGDDSRIAMPAWRSDLSSERVLAMTYVDGSHMSEFLATNPDQQRIDHFGQQLWDFIHDQVERRIYTFHADIHPGNFLFRDDGRLGILDYGCVKQFPPEFLDTCIRMLTAHVVDDEEAIRDCYYQIGILGPDAGQQQSQSELYDFIHDFGRFVLLPYTGDSFDFGDRSFRLELNKYIRASMQWRGLRVSPHFIFVNRLLFGLYAMLMQLKPRIATRRSREILIAAEARSHESKRADA